MVCLSCSTASWTVVSGLHLTPTPGSSIVRKDTRQFKRLQDRGLFVAYVCGCVVVGKVKDVSLPLPSSQLGHHRHRSCHWAAACNYSQLPTSRCTKIWVSHRTPVAYSGFAHTVLSFIPWLQQSYPFLDKNLRSSLSPITPVPASRHHKVFCSHSRPFRKRQSHLCDNFPHRWKENGLVARQLASSLALL